MKTGSRISAIKCPNCGSNCEINGDKIHCAYCNTDFVMHDDNIFVVKYEKVIKYTDEADLERAKAELEHAKVEREKVSSNSKSDTMYYLLLFFIIALVFLLGVFIIVVPGPASR